MMFVRNDCKVFRFCRSKCHRHFKAKHNPRKTAWTKIHRKLHGKEMEIDSTFDLEKKRNTPIKYDRNVWVKTVQAMKTIDKIRQARTERFHKARLAKMTKVHRTLAEKELQKHKHLMDAPTKEEVKAKRVAKKKALLEETRADKMEVE